MKVDSNLARKIEAGDFILTAEYAPGPAATPMTAAASLNALGDRPAAVGMSDNPHGVTLSSLAACVAAMNSGVEPILQMVTRDRNRIAIQSDLLGASSLGIKNLLCISGYHQTLIGCEESANVFDIDSTQLIEMVSNMSRNGVLSDGKAIDGTFSMLVGAVANPYLKPLELNLIRLAKKVQAGAMFILTHAVFDMEPFSLWLDAARKEGLTRSCAIIAGIYPLQSAAEALNLRETFAEFQIPDSIIERLDKAGDAARNEGIAICAETISRLKPLDGLRGIHILSGGREAVVPDIVAASGL